MINECVDFEILNELIIRVDSTCKIVNRSKQNKKFHFEKVLKTKRFHIIQTLYTFSKENRIYIRGEFREFLGMNFFNPFQPEREFKVYKSCKCSQIICSRVH